jgi:hypothetical protein
VIRRLDTSKVIGIKTAIFYINLSNSRLVFRQYVFPPVKQYTSQFKIPCVTKYNLDQFILIVLIKNDFCPFVSDIPAAF